MIDEYNKATIEAVQGKKVELEVNWDEKHKDFVRISIGDEKGTIKKDDLVNCMMLYGSEKHIQDLIPTKLTKVRRYETILEFQWKASRNIKKGEEITVRAPHIVELPIEDEVYAGVLDKKRLEKIIRK